MFVSKVHTFKTQNIAFMFQERIRAYNCIDTAYHCQPIRILQLDALDSFGEIELNADMAKKRKISGVFSRREIDFFVKNKNHVTLPSLDMNFRRCL